MKGLKYGMRCSLLCVCLFCACSGASAAFPEPFTWHLVWEPEKIVSSVRGNAKNVRISVEDNAIVLEIAPDSKAAGFEFFPEFNAELRRGEPVILQVDIKGDKIVPLDFLHKEPVVVVAAFPDQQGNLRAAKTPEGTFDWQTVNIAGYVPSRGKIRIIFGIRRGSGKLWVRDPRLLYRKYYPYVRSGFGGSISF